MKLWRSRRLSKKSTASARYASRSSTPGHSNITTTPTLSHADTAISAVENLQIMPYLHGSLPEDEINRDEEGSMAGTSEGHQVGFMEGSNSGNTFDTAGIPPITADNLPGIHSTMELTSDENSVDRESILSHHSSIQSRRSYSHSRNRSDTVTENPGAIHDDQSGSDSLNRTQGVNTSVEFGHSIHARDGDTHFNALQTCLEVARSAARMEYTSFFQSYSIFRQLNRVAQGLCALLRLFEVSFTQSEHPHS
jgi:hypothetical protein